MKFMTIFWIIFLIFLILLIIQYFSKNKKLKDKLNNVGIFLILLAFSFLVVAIVTNDPLFQSLGVPQEFEWIVGLFLVALSSWKLYFNPLKVRVIALENEVSSLDTGVRTGFSSIKEDLAIIN